jgi:hypothetical protein
MLRARAAAFRGVGLAAAARVVCPMRRRRVTGYWLPRCRGRQWPGAVFQAPGAARRFSSPSKTPHLQVWTLSTRPERHRTGGRLLSRDPPMRPASSPGVSKIAPPSVSARCVRSRRAPSCDDSRLRPGRCHSPRRLPPLPFLPASTVCSAARLAGFGAFGVPVSKLTSSRRRLSRNRPWGSCRFGSCRHVRSLSIRPGAFRRQNRKDRELAGRARRCVPGHALPFEAFPSSAAVPSSPTGDTFSPLQVAAAGRRVRLRTAAPTPLAAAGLKALLRCRVRRRGRCCQRPRPDAPMGLFLERAGGVLPRVLGGQAAQ